MATTSITTQTVLIPSITFFAPPMRGLIFSHGYLRSNPKNGTIILGAAGSRMWETGSSKQRNIRIGSMAFAVKIRPCFATDIRGSVKPILGEKSYPPWGRDVAKKL